jgi:formylglycine-generating enzyme required for sulfatase activity
VTVAQFREYVEETGSEHNPESLRAPANQPVTAVTWYEAVGFCEWLTAAGARRASWRPVGV